MLFENTLVFVHEGAVIDPYFFRNRPVSLKVPCTHTLTRVLDQVTHINCPSHLLSPLLSYFLEFSS